MRKILLSAFLLFSPFATFAQRGAGAAAAPHAPMAVAAPHAAAPSGTAHTVPVRAAAHPAAAHAPVSHMRPVGTHTTAHPGAPVSVRRVTSPASPVFTNPRPGDTFPVPGLGFDYPHFFATHPNFGKNRNFNGFVLPFFGGGIYVPYPYYAEPPTAEEVAADEGDAQQSVQAAAEPAQAVPVMRTETYTPVQPQSEFVFVRRDGTVFFAIAYAWSADKLQYVTKEGAHRSVTTDSIDLDATQQFNEQRGVSIRLPA